MPRVFALLGFSFYVQPIVNLAGHATSEALPFRCSCIRVHRFLIAIVRSEVIFDSFVTQLLLLLHEMLPGPVGICLTQQASATAVAGLRLHVRPCPGFGRFHLMCPLFFACLPVLGQSVKPEPDVSGRSALKVSMAN